MAGSGTPDMQLLDCKDLKVAIVASSWHIQVMDGLLAGAERACQEYGVRSQRVVRVPGAFELPVVCDGVAKLGFDAIVALGVVIRGGTPHFDYVCSGVTDGLVRVSLDHGVPVGFGVLTCDNDAQAFDRAGLPKSREDKGYEATAAALHTARALRQL
jgi:6,7-dimethyl-8-ribityllumazine synthase